MIHYDSFGRSACGSGHALTANIERVECERCKKTIAYERAEIRKMNEKSDELPLLVKEEMP